MAKGRSLPKASEPLNFSDRFATLPAVWRGRRRQPEVSLPDRSTVELDRQAVGRIDGALLKVLDPNVSRPVDPGARRDAGLGQQIHIPAILRDVGGPAGDAGRAQLHAK